MPGLMVPSNTRTSTTTPRYASYQLSKMSARTALRSIGLGRRDAVDDRLEHLVDADAGLGGHQQRVGGVEADGLLDLLLDPVGARDRQIDLVEHRDDVEIVVERDVDVGERLRLDALRGVDDQERAFAGGQRPRHLVVEVDVAGRVDQVELIGLAVVGLVRELDRLRLDRDAALALELHVVEELVLHLARGDRATALQDAVGERRLAVIDVSDDREVTDPLGRERHRTASLPHACHSVSAASPRKAMST